MGRVAREMVEQARVDVNELLETLVAAAGAEFTTGTSPYVSRFMSADVGRA